jgi:kinesin family protein 4/21/27
MGTGFDMALDAGEVGVIPRAVNQIFSGIEERRREAIERNEPPPQYELTAQFLEVYYSNVICL